MVTFQNTEFNESAHFSQSSGNGHLFKDEIFSERLKVEIEKIEDQVTAEESEYDFDFDYSNFEYTYDSGDNRPPEPTLDQVMRSLEFHRKKELENTSTGDSTQHLEKNTPSEEKEDTWESF